MKIWTYGEAKQKIYDDCDLSDETFVSPNEMIGYFNEGLTETEAEIHLLNAEAEYFKTKYFVPFTTGVGKYDLPDNIYANKICAIMYANGPLIYPIVQYRRRFRYENMLQTDQFGQADEYRYSPFNDIPGQARIEIRPVARESAILPPSASAFTPVIMWYIRNCARVPKMAYGSAPADFCNPEIVNPTSVNIATDQIQTVSGSTSFGVKAQGAPGCYPGSLAYITGDQVKLYPGPGGTMPAPLVAGTTYFVIAGASGLIKLATSAANATAGTAIDLTTTGTVFLEIRVAATQAIVDATIIDIPEFTNFVIQWAKCCAILKEIKAVPQEETDKLGDFKKQMIDSLTLAIPDDDDEIQADYSHYAEMS